MNRPIRLFTYVLVRVAPIAAVVLVVIWLGVRFLAEETTQQNANGQLAVEVAYASDIVGQNMQSLMAATEILAANELVINGLIDFEGRPNYLPAFFRSLNMPGPAQASITLIDYRGRPIASNQKDMPDYSNTDWLPQVLEGRQLFHFDPDGVYHIIVPVFYMDLPEGGMVVEYKAEAARDMLANAIETEVINQPDSFFIVDTNTQRVLYSSNPALVRVNNTDPGSQIEGWFQVRKSIPEIPDLLLVSAKPEETAFALVDSVTSLLMLALLLNLGLLIAGIGLTARWITNPLTSFIQNIRSIRGSTDLKHRMPSSKIIEFNHLGTAFNAMLDDLQKTTVSRNYVDNIFKSMNDALAVVSLEGDILTVNPALCALLEYDETEFIGQPFRQILPDSDFTFEEGWQLIENASTNNTALPNLAQNLETTYLSATGEQIPVLCSSSVMYGQDKEIWGLVCVAQDITKLKRAQKALTRSEAEARKLALVASRTDNGVIITDALGHIEWVNDGFTRISEYSLEEVEDKTPSSFLPGPKSDVEIVEHIQSQMKAGEGFSVELLNYTKSGQSYWVAIDAQPIHDETGQLVNYIMVERDITERKQANEALQKSEAEARQLALVASRTDNGVIITDASGHIEWVNEGFTRITEYTLDEVMGKTPGSFLQGTQTDPEAVAYMRTQVEQGQGFNVEIVNYAKSGRMYWLAIDAQPIYGEAGELIKFIAIESDITQRKEAEEALRESEGRVVQYLEALPLGVYVLDAQGTPYFANQVSQQLLGQGIAPHVEADQLSEVYQAYIAGTDELYPTERLPIVIALSGESSMIDDIEVHHPSGKVIPLEVLATPVFDENGKVTYAIAAFQDISARKEAEEKLKQLNEELEMRVQRRTTELTTMNEQLQAEIIEREMAEAALKNERASLAERVDGRTAELSQANAELARVARLKDEFLASMSHELRTPLNAILGMSEALQEQVYGPLNEDQLDFLHDIEESGRHLLALINDILDLSKIEAGKLELHINEVGVGPICEASLRLIKQAAHKKKLKVTSNIDSSVTSLQADERQLKQILVNLLSNAVKFTPNKGTIGLEVVGDKAKETVCFIVSDKGIGIAEDDMKRLFQPFVQLDSSLARQHAGTGLGLALVYRLAELHGGSVSIESRVGQGSRFIVTLPWTEAEVSQPDDEVGGQKIERVKPIASVKLTPSLPLILLVEDNELNIKMTLPYLKHKGYRVHIARNGLEALERVRENQPDVILMDIQMPGMDGLEATQHIRADIDLAKIPIIALTALAMPGDRERCLAAGVDEYLSKPVSLQQLGQVIEHHLKVEPIRQVSSEVQPS